MCRATVGGLMDNSAAMALLLRPVASEPKAGTG